MKSRSVIVLLGVFIVIAAFAVFVGCASDNNADMPEETYPTAPSESITDLTQEQERPEETEKSVLDLKNIEYEIAKPESALAALEAIADTAKKLVAESCAVKWPYNGLPDYEYCLYRYSVSLNDVPYRSEYPSVDFISSDTTKFYYPVEDKSVRQLEYLVFLTLLTEEYSDCIGYLDYKYLDYNYNRIFIPLLVFCPDYSEYGYETIYDYIDAAVSGEGALSENSYVISFASESIREHSSNTELYDTIFNNTVSE